MPPKKKVEEVAEPVVEEKTPEIPPPVQVDAEFVFPMGEHYTGGILRFHDETYQFNGQGVYTAGADQFSGEYKAGQMHRGTYTFGNGDAYEGFFANGKFHGEGTYHFANGGSYTGMFYDGKMHGQGSWKGYSPNNPTKVFSGISVSGEFRSSYHKQQTAKNTWEDFYRELVSQSVLQVMNPICENEDEAAAEADLQGITLTSPSEPEQSEEAEDVDPVPPPPESDIVDGPFPQSEQVNLGFVKELVSGLSSDEVTSEISVPCSVESCTVIDGNRIKFPLARFQAQVLELKQKETGKGVAMINTNMDGFDLAEARWKIVAFSDPSAAEE